MTVQLLTGFGRYLNIVVIILEVNDWFTSRMDIN